MLYYKDVLKDKLSTFRLESQKYSETFFSDNPTLKNVESSKSLLKRLIIGLKNISKNESVYSVKLRKLKKRRKKH